ncbi:hypothetical protein BGX27_009613 [Mortierella sp. AM989]|nr:hypothetical protein BGX27_009613 [Mortierella sp. AM989]
MILTRTNSSPGAILLSIPLIVDLVCLHLSCRDIYRCTLVSRDLYFTFNANIFSTINIQWRATFNKWARYDTQTLLASRLRTVKSITTVFGNAIQLLLQANSSSSSSPSPPMSIPNSAFHRLTILRCLHLPASPSNIIQNIRQLPNILTVVENSSNLELLELDFFDFGNNEITQRLLAAIRKKGQRLYEFRISNNRSITSKLVRQILWSCAAVQRLSIKIQLNDEWAQHDVDDEGYSDKEREEDLQLEAMAREALFNDNSKLGQQLRQQLQSKVDAARRSEPTDMNALSFGFAWVELNLPALGYKSVARTSFFSTLRHCPLLERFTPPSIQGPYVFSKVLTEFKRHNPIPRLEHLDLNYLDRSVSGRRTSQAVMLTYCKNLKSVVLGKSIAGSIDSILVGNSHSLEKLVILRVASLSSENIQLVLKSCPSLKHFEALDVLRRFSNNNNGTARVNNKEKKNPHMDPVLKMRELNSLTPEDDTSWVCLGLETLRLCYLGQLGGIGIPKLLRKQVAKLTRLKDLRLHNVIWIKVNTSDCENDDDEDDDEKESVRLALQEWNVLTHLVTLELRGLKSFVDPEDVASMRRQWKDLKWIHYS